MSEINIKTLEQYLFASDKTTFLEKLINGTDSSYYFTLNHALNTYGLNLPKKYQDEYQDYKLFGTPRSQNISLRHSFLELAKPNQNQARRKEILKEINDQYLSLSFDFEAPQAFSSKTEDTSKPEVKSVLDEKIIGWLQVVEKAYNDENTFNSLQNEALQLIDLEKLVKSTNKNIGKSFLNRALLAEFPGIEEFIQKYLLENKNFQLGKKHFEKMTLDQLKKFGKLRSDIINNTDYASVLFQKEFETEFDENVPQNTTPQKIQRQKKLLKMAEWVKNTPHKHQSLLSFLLFEYLHLGIEINVFDFDVFIDYLRNPRRIYMNTNAQQRKNLTPVSQVAQILLPDITDKDNSHMCTDEELINIYLENYFRINKKVEPFDEFFETTFLTQLFHKVRIYDGEQISNITEILSADTLKKLEQEKIMTICKFNTDSFDSGEEVKLYVEVKNIPSLTIKVFEISTEDYYQKKTSEIAADVKVDGLIANEESFFEFKDAPQKKVIKEFKFSSLTQKKRGVFIIDFLGNGLSSRAVIRKGKLILLEKASLTGQIFTILDEDLEICSSKGSRTGIWVKGKFHEANENGQVNLPFSQSRESVSAIIVHGDFASLTAIYLIEESYVFKCSYLYKDESLIMGNKMKLLIQPKLYLNLQPMNLDIIQGQTINVVTRADNDIPSTIVFDKIKFDYKQEVEIEIPIPAKLNSIRVEVKGKIKKMISSSNQELEISHSHDVTLNNYVNEDKFCGLHLRLTDKDYEIYLLGKNGEPKSYITVNLEFRNKFLKNTVPTQLQTDSEGKVSLGKLKDITWLRATVKEKGDIKATSMEWSIENKGKVDLPEYVNICSGDALNLPYIDNGNQVKLFRCINENSILSNENSKLKLSKNKLELNGLAVGQYILKIDEKQIININVNEGKYWKNSDMIITSQNFLELNKNLPIIFIQDIDLSKNGKLTVSVFSNDMRTTRIHVLAYNFLNNRVNKYYDTLKQNIEQKDEQVISINKNKNQYLSNKTLSSEYCYVLDRKKQERYIGNTLEKPQILLKRTFQRDTTLEKEELVSETAYKEKKEMKKEKEGRKIMEKKKKKRETKPRFDDDSEASYRGEENEAGIPAIEAQPSSFLNFLHFPCLIQGNLKPNAEGKVIIENIDLSAFSTVEIIATNLNTVIHEVVPLKKNLILTKNLTQGVSDEKSKKFYSIFRNISSVPKGEKFKVEDMTSTELKIIDSLGKVFDVQLELEKVNPNPYSSPQNQKFEDWRFLTKWNSLDIDEKQKKYDQYACHELNIFLYFKDRAYFDEYVRPFISNKIEKGFVDFFLLDDQKSLAEYNQVEEIAKLNVMEKVLLLITLLRQKKTDDAIAIASYLETENKAVFYDQNNFQRMFDTILGSKIDLKTEQPKGNSDTMFFGFCAMPPPMSQMRALENYGVEKGCEDYNYECEEMKCCDFGEECCDEGEDNFSYEEKFEEKRNAYIQEFKNLEKTKEYAERSYFNISNKEDITRLMLNNHFWAELAKHLIEKGLEAPFISTKFIYSSDSNAAKILTLAFLGLDFEFGNHNYQNLQGRGVQIEAASNFIVFHKEIKEAQSNIKPDLMIAQRFYDPSDRYQVSEDEPNVKYEKEVEEFVIDKIYGCEIIVTNLSITRQEFQVLYEIPEGSIPVKKNDYTKSSTLQVNSFTTQTLEFFFYFPGHGKFKAAPANISKNGSVMAVAKDRYFEVLLERSSKNLATMQQILTRGSKEDILNFLATKNILNPETFQFQDICHLLTDEKFYLKVLEILRKRRIFNYNVWSFSVYHGDLPSLREFLNSSNMCNIFLPYINYFSNEIIRIKKIRLLEYYPLMNSRVHQLSQEKDNILNYEFKNQYQSFLEYLVEVPKPHIEDLLSLIYYLLLQDRIDEAIKIYEQINVKEITENGLKCQLQYDYFTGYLDFYIGYPNFKKAREICEKYLDYPVLSWRNLFYEIANQLAEYDGEDLIDDTEANKEKKLNEKQQNIKGAETEEIVNAELIENNLHLKTQNCKSLIINYYLIDLEVLYSRNPFLLQGSDDDFGYILPNQTEIVSLEGNSKTLKIPEKLAKNNIFIQMKGNSKTTSLTYFSTSLKVHIIEAYAQIKVTDNENKPLSQVYVKTFSKNKSGEVSFYKDGYTDLRGRFDYASLNSESLNTVEKFSIFIMSDKLGSLIKEALPPSTLGKISTSVNLISDKWNKKAIIRKEEIYQNYVMEQKSKSKK